MVENEPLTPEKQLLKLIEKPKGETVAAEHVKREGKKWFSLDALKGRLAYLKSFSLKKWLWFRRESQTSFGLRQINFILKCAVLFLTLFLGYSVIVMALELTRASNLIFRFDQKETVQPEPSPVLKDLSSYLDKVRSRDIFNVGTAAVEKAQEEAVKEVPPPEVKRNFSLVGIAWSENPEAMIEDVDEKRTHFMKRGQAIDDEVKVVSIFKDRVILNYKGEEVELR